MAGLEGWHMRSRPLIGIAWIRVASAQDAILILRQHCLPCHNSRTCTMENRDSLIAVGKPGAVVRPGEPGKIILLLAVSFKAEVKMPPAGRLSDDQSRH